MSLSGDVTGCTADLGLHYQLVRDFHPDAMLTGSSTARSGIDLFCQTIPAETSEDLIPQDKNGLPCQIIVDSRGMLINLLHVFRQSPYTGEVIVLVSEKTPEEYIAYLAERQYPYFRCGRDRVDMPQALQQASAKYGLQTIVCDSGPQLVQELLKLNMVNTISLLVSPEITPTTKPLLGPGVSARLQLAGCQQYNDYLHLKYTVGKPPKQNPS